MCHVAHASAWVQTKESVFGDTEVSQYSGDFGPGWQQSSYLEYGVSDNLTFVGKVDTAWSQTDTGGNRSGGELAMRRRIVQSGGFALSGQVGLLVGQTTEFPRCQGAGSDVRLGAGYGWGDEQSRRGFASAAMAWRDRGGCQGPRLEVTVGQEMSDHFSVESKFFHSGEPGGQGQDSTKIQLGLAYRFERDEKRHALGVAYRKEIGGAFEEDAAVLSYTRRF